MNATLTVNDVELYYTRWGNEGDTRIMLVHGWTGSNEVFRDFRFMLAERGFDVVAVDLRGHGRSSKPEGEYTHELFSADVHGLAEALEWMDGFALLGQSMGGYIVLDYALRYPETLTHVITCNTSVNLGGTLLSTVVWRLNMFLYSISPKMLMQMVGPKFFHNPQPPSVIAELVEMSLQTPKFAGLSAIRNCFRRNLEPELDRITVPTLVVASEFDQKDLRDATLRIHELIPNSKLVDVPGCGHLPFVENPEYLINAIGDFVKG
ncbi:MAG: alpha/beta hydrolase [Anaerolineales bacterium]|nr:MAG: alpha/beta hydrolase [Anaerolineales bacterium]